MAYDLRALAKRKNRRKKVRGVALEVNTRGADRIYRIELRAGMQRIINVWIEADRKARALLNASPVTTDRLTQDDSREDLLELLELAREEAERISLAVIAAIPVTIGAVERRHNRSWRAAIKKVLGVDLGEFLAIISLEPTIRAHQAWAASLIKDFTEDARKRVSSIVLRSVVERSSSKAAGKEIANALGIIRRRADFIATDQARKLTAEFTRLRSEEAGVDKYIWRHSRKKNPREEHVAREGNIYSWKHPPRGGHPRTEPNCGCIPQPYIPLMDELEGA